MVMATAKTGSFYLTETVQIPAGTTTGTRVQGVIDLGAYVNVATGQAVAIESVDFILQTGDGFSQELEGMIQSNGTYSFQLTDLNPGTVFVRADDQSLIASGALNIDFVNNLGTEVADFYPDDHGKASLSESFMVVNDSLYLVGGINGSTSTAAAINYITARCKCRIVKLGQSDWIALAIQSTASDN
jgi:hypothetical protein